MLWKSTARAANTKNCIEKRSRRSGRGGDYLESTVRCAIFGNDVPAVEALAAEDGLVLPTRRARRRLEWSAMASRDVAVSSSAALRNWDLQLSPLDKVRQFFEALSELRRAADDTPDDKARFVVVRNCNSLSHPFLVLFVEAVYLSRAVNLW